MGVAASKQLGIEKMPKKSDIVQTPQEIFNQIPRGSPAQDVFGWTVPVEQIPLPSGGIVYDLNSSLHGRETVQIKAMTAQEEDILMSRALLRDGTVFQHLIRSCLTDKSVDPGELLIGDRNAILVSIRITGYGSEYKATATCTSCAKPGSYSFDLSSVGIKRLGSNPISTGRNEFEFLLPVTKKRVIFKLLTINDEREIAQTQERMSKLFPDAKVEGTVTRQLENQIVSIDGKTDRSAISAFIKSMPAGDSRALRRYMVDIEPGLDMTMDFECKSCGSASKAVIPLGAAFFWPE